MSRKSRLRILKFGKKNTQPESWVSETRLTSTQTFEERPPFRDGSEGRSAGDPAGRIGAHDLFSMFTADIIRERTNFIR